MKYAQKPVVFDTVEISRIPLTKHPFDALSEMPHWLQNALAKGDVRPVGSRVKTVNPFWGFEVFHKYGSTTAWPTDFIAQLQIEDGITDTSMEPGDITVIRASFLSTYYERINMSNTPEEAPIGHPEPPHETTAGADSTPAPNLAEMAGDQLEAEELETDE